MDSRSHGSGKRRSNTPPASMGGLPRITDLISDGLFIYDTDQGEFRLITRKVSDILGRGGGSIKDIDIPDLFHEEDRDLIRGAIDRIIQEDNRASSELVVRTCSGREGSGWIRLRLQALNDEEQENCIAGSVSDIQSLKEAQMEAQFYLDLMTHDITNKHQVVLMNLEMLRHTLNIPGDKTRHLTSCVKQLGKAMDTIRSVKIMADVGIGPLSTYPVDLIESIRKGMQAVENYHPYLSSRIDMDLPMDEAMVLADEKLQLVVYHLLNNSISHNTSPEPTVKVTVDKSELGYRMTVEDNGPGIPRDVINDLEDLTPRDVSRAQGRGLGLTLTSILVNAYRGDFSIENRKTEEENEGCVAVVDLRSARGNGE